MGGVKMCRPMRTLSIAVLVFFLFSGLSRVEASASLSIEEHDIQLMVNETKVITVEISGKLEQEVQVEFRPVHNDLLTTYPDSITLKPDGSDKFTFSIEGRQPGHSLVIAYNASDVSTGLNLNDAFLRVTVQLSYVVNYISVIVGWTYFFAWSISFYPQMYQNWSRKSVVGLNFDFLALNLLGFTLYAIFNIGLYYIPEVEAMYFKRHPRGTNPVQLNDIVFAVHATFATIITIIQCRIYDSGAQRVSHIAKGLLVIFFIIIATILGMSIASYITWLDFLYYCSSIKLTITLIKYIPQAYMNYTRKSTLGWSIGNVLLDFTGGLLSMAQMLLNAFNFDDWASIFGDPTKFGLGLFSVVFDIFFMIQHYILYRSSQFDYTCDIKRVDVSDPVLSSIYEEKTKMLKPDSPA